MKLIIFDLDGTLLDTGEGIIKSLKFALSKFGLPVPNDETCKSFVGPPLKKRFLELYDSDEQTAGALLACFREEYGKGDLFLASRYEGMEECLNNLHTHYSLAVATNKREDHAKALIEKFDMLPFFDAICGSNPSATMTKEKIIKSTTKRLRIPLSDSLMIGDSDNDAIAADNLGIPFIGVTYGYGFKNTADIAQFPHIGSANTPLEIKKFIVEN